MEIGLLFKIAGIGMIVTVLCQVLSKSGRDEQAMLLSVAGIILVIGLLLSELSVLVSDIRDLFGI